MKESKKQKDWDFQLHKERKFYCERERENLPEDCPNICCTWCFKRFLCDWICGYVYEIKGRTKCLRQCSVEEAILEESLRNFKIHWS